MVSFEITLLIVILQLCPQAPAISEKKMGIVIYLGRALDQVVTQAEI